MARITGLATGLDVDTIIKQTMQAYRTKIDTQQQKKDILEIKQKLYRDVITDAQKLYNTHFDVLKSGSLISSNSWQSVKFTSSNESAVTVTGSSTAKIGNYTVTGTKAKAASATLSELGETVTINGKKFTVEGLTNKEKAINLNKSLSDAGVNVSVRYTDFANQSTTDTNSKGFIFESKVLGKDNNFVINGTTTNSKLSVGTNATATTITGLEVDALKNNAVATETDVVSKITLKIDDKEITIDIAKESTNNDIKSLLNIALSEKGYTVDVDDFGNVTLNSSSKGSGQTSPEIKIKDKTSGDFVAVTTKFTDGKDATSASVTLDSSDLDKSLLINGVNIDLSNLDLTGLKNESEKNLKRIEYLNKILTNQNTNITASVDKTSVNIILDSKVTGENSKINFSLLNGGTKSSRGSDANFVIKDDKGGVYTHTGTSNSVALDGITFNFTGEISSDKEVSINSKIDASEIVDKVKSYIEDYNALIVKINTLTSEKRDRSYEPLTSEQKAEMSEKEIELWESKVKQGQLRRDSELMRINNNLQQGMKNLVSGTGLTLKDIGIESVADYGGTKDGTFKINEDSLKKAIEDDTEGVMKLFMQSAPSNASENESYNENGIMMRLKDTLYKETVKTDSSIIKKAGFEGTTTVTNNTLTKAMQEHDKKMSEMEKIFSRKEQTLYSQYAKLETLMNNYNSQMSYLSQSLGLST